MELLSATEIAALGLPDLPKTKVAIRAMAEREGWRFELRTGVGGTRKMYELPARFRDQLGKAPTPNTAPTATIAGGRRADVDKLRIAVRALEEFAQERNLQIDPDRKSAIIALLYDYLERGAGTEELSNLLSVVR